MIHIAICDDETHMSDHLRVMVSIFFLRKNKEIHLRSFLSGEKLLNCDGQIDILFLDIQMKDMDDMDMKAKGYMYIDCLWVFGQFKEYGYSNLLLDACIEDSKAKGKKGLVILSSKKKMGFYFELMYLPFSICWYIQTIQACVS